MEADVSQSINEFFSRYPLKRYNKGQILIYANEDPSGIFYLESGSVRKYDVSAQGDDVVLNVFKPKIFFPINWAINKAPNRYFFEATSAIEVRKAPVAEVTAFLESHPKLAYTLLKRVHGGLEDTQRRIVYLMHGNTRQRLLFELLIEGRRSGDQRADGSCLISVGMSDIAQRAGLSRETISRELGRLMHDDDILERQGRSLLIHDLHRLETLLDEDA